MIVMKQKALLTLLAMALVAASLNAADERSAAAPGKKINPLAVGDGPPLDIKSQKRVERAHHLAEKGANTEFLNSPQGIAFKQQIAAVEQEINAVYEQYLNLCRVDPATEKGQSLRAERNRLLQALAQKQKKIEADYESLKKASPVYRAMVAKHLKSELNQLKGKLKSQSPEEKDDDKE